MLNINNINKSIYKIHKKILNNKISSIYFKKLYLLKKKLIKIEYLINNKLILDNNVKYKILKNNILKEKNKIIILETYLQRNIEEQQSINVNMITLLNAIYIPLALLFAYYGMNLKEINNYTYLSKERIFIFILIILIIIFIYIFLRNKKLHNIINNFIKY